MVLVGGLITVIFVKEKPVERNFQELTFMEKVKQKNGKEKIFFAFSSFYEFIVEVLISIKRPFVSTNFLWVFIINTFMSSGYIFFILFS